MAHNFAFIEPFWPNLASFGKDAQKYTFEDPQSALIKLRCFAESAVGIIYAALKLPCLPTDSFAERLKNDAFLSVIDRALIEKFHLLRIEGNKAAHGGNFNKKNSQWLLKEAHIIASWLFLLFKKGAKENIPKYLSPTLKNNTNTLLKTKLAHQKERHEALLAELEAIKETEKKAQQDVTKLAQALDEIKQQKYQKQSAKACRSIDLNEKETRQRLINTQLFDAGWYIDQASSKNTTDVTLEEPVTVENNVSE